MIDFMKSKFDNPAIGLKRRDGESATSLGLYAYFCSVLNRVVESANSFQLVGVKSIGVASQIEKRDFARDDDGSLSVSVNSRIYLVINFDNNVDGIRNNPPYKFNDDLSADNFNDPDAYLALTLGFKSISGLEKSNLLTYSTELLDMVDGVAAFKKESDTLEKVTSRNDDFLVDILLKKGDRLFTLRDYNNLDKEFPLEKETLKNIHHEHVNLKECVLDPIFKESYHRNKFNSVSGSKNLKVKNAVQNISLTPSEQRFYSDFALTEKDISFDILESTLVRGAGDKEKTQLVEKFWLDSEFNNNYSKGTVAVYLLGKVNSGVFKPVKSDIWSKIKDSYVSPTSSAREKDIFYFDVEKLWLQEFSNNQMHSSRWLGVLCKDKSYYVNGWNNLSDNFTKLVDSILSGVSETLQIDIKYTKGKDGSGRDFYTLNTDLEKFNTDHFNIVFNSLVTELKLEQKIMDCSDLSSSGFYVGMAANNTSFVSNVVNISCETIIATEKRNILMNNFENIKGANIPSSSSDSHQFKL